MDKLPDLVYAIANLAINWKCGEGDVSVRNDTLSFFEGFVHEAAHASLHGWPMNKKTEDRIGNWFTELNAKSRYVALTAEGHALAVQFLVFEELRLLEHFDKEAIIESAYSNAYGTGMTLKTFRQTVDDMIIMSATHKQALWVLDELKRCSHKGGL